MECIGTILLAYRQVNSAASPRFETTPMAATPVAAVVVRKNTRRVILVMGDLLCSRFDRLGFANCFRLSMAKIGPMAPQPLGTIIRRFTAKGNASVIRERPYQSRNRHWHLGQSCCLSVPAASTFLLSVAGASQPSACRRTPSRSHLPKSRP
jgi:hypothetical protein